MPWGVTADLTSVWDCEQTVMLDLRDRPRVVPRHAPLGRKPRLPRVALAILAGMHVLPDLTAAARRTPWTSSVSRLILRSEGPVRGHFRLLRIQAWRSRADKRGFTG